LSLLACLALLLSAPVSAAEPWHLADWPCRAVVEIPKPLAEAGGK
jgi:hypothetical protein